MAKKQSKAKKAAKKGKAAKRAYSRDAATGRVTDWDKPPRPTKRK